MKFIEFEHVYGKWVTTPLQFNHEVIDSTLSDVIIRVSPVSSQDDVEWFLCREVTRNRVRYNKLL